MSAKINIKVNLKEFGHFTFEQKSATLPEDKGGLSLPYAFPSNTNDGPRKYSLSTK